MNPNQPSGPQSFSNPYAQKSAQSVAGYKPKKSVNLVVVIVILAVLALLFLVFGIWAFVGKQKSEKNVNKQIEIAKNNAISATSASKETEFENRQKDPYKYYNGSATFGTLSFGYPKSWSVFKTESNSGTILDFYSEPNYISNLKSDNFGLRVKLEDSPYADQLAAYDKSIAAGTVKSSAFRLKKMPETLGSKLTGAIFKEKTGTLVMLPLRDKTVFFWTEDNKYDADLQSILDTVSFVP